MAYPLGGISITNQIYVIPVGIFDNRSRLKAQSRDNMNESRSPIGTNEIGIRNDEFLHQPIYDEIVKSHIPYVVHASTSLS